MHDQSHSPIQSLVLAESTVSTFMCQNPNTSKNKTLNSGVCNPSSESKVWIWEHWDEGEGEVNEGGDVEVIADNVCH